MTENNQNNNNSWRDRLTVLRVLKKNIIMRAGLAIATIALTGVLIFSLTVAWSTNVVQTSGLEFGTDVWEFDGEITVYDQNIDISPGDVGVIPMKIENKGNHVVVASVNASKNQMEEAMKKRLYFYVDDSIDRRGETLERVYISSVSSYTYVIFPNSDLVLTEDRKNGPLIKYEWVYDVLGYYVLGEKVQGENGVTDVSVKEYIRPIVYDYDETLTTFNGQQLATIDGVKTAGEFLTEISMTDGYEGTIDLDSATTTGYYPIYVNSEGYGVWAHLCTLAEIKQNTLEDNLIGTSGNTGSQVARITVTGQNSREDYTPVKSETDFIAALNETRGGIVKLEDDIVLTDVVELASDTSVIVDLNGKTLSSNNNRLIEVKEGASIAITNGTLKGGTARSVAAYVVGGSVSLSNVEIKDVYRGVEIRDNLSTSKLDSTVYITDANIVASDVAVFAYGNGDANKEKTVLVVENSTLIGTASDSAGIWFNGSYHGSETTVINSTVKGVYTGIYHPLGESILNVIGSTVEGGNGISIKAGEVNVTDSTIIGIAKESEPEFVNSGFTIVGAGVSLEAGYNWPIKININNCTVTSKNTRAVVSFIDGAKHTAEIILNGGTYTSYSDSTSLPDGFSQQGYIDSLAGYNVTFGDGFTATISDEKTFYLTEAE